MTDPQLVAVGLFFTIQLNQLIVCQDFSINKSDFHAILKTEQAKQPSNIEMEGISYFS
jgi:hypothetical protein